MNSRIAEETSRLFDVFFVIFSESNFFFLLTAERSAISAGRRSAVFVFSKISSSVMHCTRNLRKRAAASSFTETQKKTALASCSSFSEKTFFNVRSAVSAAGAESGSEENEKNAVFPV